MKYRKLGRTDIEVSVVAMGCWAIVGDWTWGEQDESKATATLRAALDAGINFFDTAEMYGDGYSESLLGKTLAGRRHEIMIASKVKAENLKRDDLLKACEKSLQRLQTDYPDLYQIHWPNRKIPVAETMGALEQLEQQGKIRAIGVSNFGAQDLGKLLTVGTCETNQLGYNLLMRAIEFEILEKCLENNIGVLCYSPLAQGLLTGKFASADDVPPARARTRHFSSAREHTRHGEPGCEAETFAALDEIRRISAGIGESMADVALAWPLHQPGVTSVIAGARKPEQIRENAKAADPNLPPEILTSLTQATEIAKQKLGPNPDIWQADSRIR